MDRDAFAFSDYVWTQADNRGFYAIAVKGACKLSMRIVKVALSDGESKRGRYQAQLFHFDGVYVGRRQQALLIVPRLQVQIGLDCTL